MRNKTIVLVIVFVFTLACNMPVMGVTTPGSGLPTLILATNDPNAAATPTPFQPLPPTPVGSTPEATATTPANKTTPAPTLLPTRTGQPTLLPTIKPIVAGKYPDGQVRILVLGSDYRPGGGFRTDIFILISITPSTGAVTVLSFPRDLYVDIPGIGMNRINTAQVYGGFALTAATLERNFGIRPQYYVLSNFQGFVSIVDSLGGLPVRVPTYLRDECSLPQQDNEGKCAVNPGLVQMNGAMALWYVRSRYSSSDFDRERRSQEVLSAVFQKLISLNALARIPELYNAYTRNVETNLTVGEIINLAPTAAQIAKDTARVRRYSIGPADTWDYIVPENGAMVLMPNMESIQKLINQAVFTP